ncbi:MAG TPA: cysteine--tRNA ligase [Afifellaceae bacterium]|nr:cysteine--tRNA ligase [Afifellaceae bacterium]
MSDDTFKGLRLYNTLSRQKEDFRPIDAGNVRMYVCGPTVYDYAHIGNARPVIVFDVLYRLLRHLYGVEHVTYVRNITDVDDKINARAAQDYPDLPLNEAIRKVTAATEEQYHKDVAALGNLKPDVEPRATEHIAEMQAMILTLIEKEHAYAADGHVLFDVKSWRSDNGSEGYGGLSRRSLDEMVAGARVEIAPYKRDPMDFVLWKPSSESEPGWDSPWSLGRPGWHIECSAMADKWLWEKAQANLSDAGMARPHQFDIHGGGIDLIFPHHENEVAQSRCAHGTPVMANYWMHNGFLQVEGQKMSKSLGNFITMHDLLDTDSFGGRKWPGEAARLAMLKTHYRQPIDWTVAALEEAWNVGVAWRELLDNVDWQASGEPDPGVTEALSDDLNTSMAIARLHDLAKEAKSNPAAAQGLLDSARLLGLMQNEGDFQRAAPAIEVDSALVEQLIAERAKARMKKNWMRADEIRDELDAMNIAVHDARDPNSGELTTTWEVKR